MPDVTAVARAIAAELDAEWDLLPDQPDECIWHRMARAAIAAINPDNPDHQLDAAATLAALRALHANRPAPHDHATYQPGCHRCDLARHETGHA